MDSLYLDYNASAPVHPSVLDVYAQVSRDAPANPSSLHRAGRRAQGFLEQARERIAGRLGCERREILFTSGATEANNLALLGAARALAQLQGRPVKLIASKAEHPAVLAPLRWLQQEGFPLRLLEIDGGARVSSSAVGADLQGTEPVVATLQWANNETGAIQDLSSWIEALPGGSHFHCDAVQGFGKLPYDPVLAQTGSFSLSAHKFRGPKGVGILRVAETAVLEPVLSGGGQQRGIRPGTESAPLAMAAAVALELAFDEQELFEQETRAASQSFREALLAELPSVRFNRSEPELPNTVNLSFPGIDGRALLPACDVAGLAVSSGAACSSGAARPSAVLLAAGLSEALAIASLRISFGWGQGALQGKEAALRLARTVGPLYRLANT